MNSFAKLDFFPPTHSLRFFYKLGYICGVLVISVTFNVIVSQVPAASTYGDYTTYMQAVTQYYSQPATTNQAYATKV